MRIQPSVLHSILRKGFSPKELGDSPFQRILPDRKVLWSILFFSLPIHICFPRKRRSISKGLKKCGVLGIFLSNSPSVSPASWDRENQATRWTQASDDQSQSSPPLASIAYLLEDSPHASDSLSTFFAVEKKGLLVWTPTLNSSPLFSFSEVERGKAFATSEMFSNLKWERKQLDKEGPSILETFPICCRTRKIPTKRQRGRGSPRHKLCLDHERIVMTCVHELNQWDQERPQ